MDIDTNTFTQYYKRQILIESFGIEEQQKIAKRSCLIIGMGGLGCPIGLYLATSGIGNIGICDYDEIEFSNIGRQILFSPQDIGQKKSSVAQKTLQNKNPFINVQAHDTILNESNAQEIISQYDLVLDCTDNFHSKYLIHDSCLYLKKDLVQGALFQTQGAILSLAFSNTTFKGCMRCMWEQEPSALCVKSCAEAGILNLVAGTVALKQATTALQFITEQYQNAGISSLYSYTTQEWMELALPYNENCAYCTKNEQQHISKEPLIITTIPDTTWCILDTRNEQDQNNFFGKYPYLNVSAEQINNPSLLTQTLNKDTHYVTICYAGIRSLDIARKLRILGYTNTHSYAGGYKKFLINEHILTD